MTCRKSSLSGRSGVRDVVVDARREEQDQDEPATNAMPMMRPDHALSAVAAWRSGSVANSVGGARRSCGRAVAPPCTADAPCPVSTLLE